MTNFLLYCGFHRQLKFSITYWLVDINVILNCTLIVNIIIITMVIVLISNVIK